MGFCMQLMRSILKLRASKNVCYLAESLRNTHYTLAQTTQRKNYSICGHGNAKVRITSQDSFMGGRYDHCFFRWPQVPLERQCGSLAFSAPTRTSKKRSTVTYMLRIEKAVWYDLRFKSCESVPKVLKTHQYGRWAAHLQLHVYIYSKCVSNLKHPQNEVFSSLTHTWVLRLYESGSSLALQVEVFEVMFRIEWKRPQMSSKTQHLSTPHPTPPDKTGVEGTSCTTLCLV